MSEISVHRWPIASLTGDVLRGAAASGIALILLLVIPVGGIAFWGVLVLFVLFVLYLASTLSRYSAVVEVDAEGLRLKGGLFGPRAIKWAELRRFELRHFPLSRDRRTGWMDLKLKDAHGSVAIDDRLDRFNDVLAKAWAAARAAELGISEATHANLIAAGIVEKRAMP